VKAHQILPLNLLSLVLTGIAWNISLAEEQVGKTKIGVAVPLTGAGAAYGTDIKNALVFTNQHLFNSRYSLIIEDDQCSNKEAASVAHRLTKAGDVKYVLGFGCSGTVLAAAPIYEKAKTIVIASGTGAPAITNAGDYIFRTKPSLIFAGQVLAQDMSRSFRKVGIITEETDYCQGLTNSVVQSLQAGAVESVNKTFLPGEESFRTLLISLKGAGVDALFLNPQGENGMVNLYRQLLDLNWKVPVYGTFMPGGEIFLSAFGSKADGIVYADVEFNQNFLNSRGRELYAEFEKTHGKAKAAEHFAALSMLAFATLDEALNSKNEVKDYLYKSKFSRLSDEYSFDKNGDIVSEKIKYVLKTIKNGRVASYQQ
jgi:branched-chain amino acid transport system substrate-binding protein